MSVDEFLTTKPKKKRQKAKAPDIYADDFKQDAISEIFKEESPSQQVQSHILESIKYTEDSFWGYATPLEQPDGFTVNSRVIEINGMPFQRRSDCTYKFCPYKIFDEQQRYESMTDAEREANPERNTINLYRSVILQDLWFIVYFVMKNPLANHPFIIQACKEIESTVADSLQVWARDHLKTTIISVGRTIQKVLQNPERRIAIFSATRPLAVKIQNSIKEIFESPILITCFPDILYEDPYKDAPKWSEAPEGGLVVKRKGFYREATISSWGLVDGQPIGFHFTDMIFDDIVTQDLQSPEIMQKVIDNFDMAENLGTRDRHITVIGTFYRHDDPLVYIMNKYDPMSGEKMFLTVKKPATIDGSFLGKSVFLPEISLARKRAGQLYIFYCQQLLDPTPRSKEKLNRDHLVMIDKKDLPPLIYKFMMVDAAGDEGKRKDGRPPDDWAIGVIGVEPMMDDLGLSDVFLLDLCIEEMTLEQAQAKVVEMFCRNGRILKLGVEKVGISTTEIHIAAALRARRRFVSVDSGNLELLNPRGRSKQLRIESNISVPLKHGKIHVLNSIDQKYVKRLGDEMEKFPRWKDDGLDMLSYGYDIIGGYRFGVNFGENAVGGEKKKEDRWDRAFNKAKEGGGKVNGWIRC